MSKKRAPIFSDVRPKKEFSHVPLNKKENGCWEWTKSLTDSGYGVFFHKKIYWRAHRLAWEIHNFQRIPKDKIIRHVCDNPPCCNPAHLLLGTAEDNAKDSVLRKRMPQGLNHWNSKLRTLDVQLIRYLRECGVEIKKLAKIFNISQATTSSVILRWHQKNVPDMVVPETVRMPSSLET